MSSYNEQYNNGLVSTRTRVSVGNMVFDIPTEKVSTLVETLNRLQSIQVSEDTMHASPLIKYNGVTLVHS